MSKMFKAVSIWGCVQEFLLRIARGKLQGNVSNHLILLRVYRKSFIELTIEQMTYLFRDIYFSQPSSRFIDSFSFFIFRTTSVGFCSAFPERLSVAQ
jgi:hypothetical protein